MPDCSGIPKGRRGSVLAFEKRGPRWGGGYLFLIHASICRKDRRAVDAADIDVVVGALRVERRDPTGNLNPR